MYTINNFDWEFYINQHKDLYDAGIKGKEQCWIHWQKHGQYENRITRKIVKKSNIIIKPNISCSKNLYNLKIKVI